MSLDPQTEPMNGNASPSKPKTKNNNNNNPRRSNRHRSQKSMSSLETSNDSRVDREEIRSVLVRHWTSLDRARLHTFHLWLFVYSLAQIFLFHYLCHRLWSLTYFVVSSLFPAYVLVSFALIRYGNEQTRRTLLTFSLVSSILLPIFLWLSHLPLISRLHNKQERVAELSSLYSSLAISTFFQFFALPRQRRLFFTISVVFNFVNLLLIAAVLYGVSSSQGGIRESPLVTVVPLFFYQLVVTCVGAICESNSAYSRATIPMVMLTDAVKRRTELETLKSRQDQLLLSVIPAYLTDKVSQSIIASSSTAASICKQNKHQKLFHELHVQVHDNVSILFADIVNFTVLAAQLGAKDLVRTLNELYSKFDEDAQKLQCMRIKFLGDCYYCVSGMPVNRPNHADMCVLMGLEMIKTIKQVRVATGVNVDMRIGVHTGSVLCGILGLKKWQYDIWSDDVTFANQMESTGVPGRVHITKKTKDMLIGDYRIVEANSDDPAIRAFGPTYHILPDKKELHERTASIYRNKFRRSVMDFGDSLNVQKNNTRVSMKTKVSKVAEFWGAETPFANLGREDVNGMENGTLGQSSSRRPKNGSTIQIMTLLENNLNNINNTSLRTMFHCTTGGYKIAKFLLFPFCREPTSLHLSECRILFLLSIPIAIANYFLVRYNVPQKVQYLIVSQIVLCLLVLLIVCLLEALCKVAKFLLILIAYTASVFLAIGQHIVISFLAVVQSGVPVFAIIWLPSCISHMCVTFALYRLPYPFRCFLASVDCSLFLLLLTMFSTSNVSSSAPIISCQLTIILVNIFALFLLLLFVAWITEYERKVEAACNVAFKNEEKEVQTMQDINNLLIENILPNSVAAKFLSPDRDTGELYARDHNNVCVMFASIPNFKDYWTECDTSRKLECLRLLNEITCEFDKLLSKPKFSCIEKIKTVSSTYMAAAGLTEADFDDHGQRNATIMIEFAMAMHTVLELLNADAFQNFQLRIGLSLGPLVAGVIGAQKPQYDIWGNTVNMASRMDSHGEVRHIHMTGDMARALPKNMYNCQSRGAIKVKGVKHEMETFLLPLSSPKRNSGFGTQAVTLHTAF
ncbi:Adenylate cyclase type 1 [Aphelenchoides bicaudatus]|nr:Adenylate cyclase type 1 [Aphelenchoides bicaudatus]